jgi:hypothetical protein
VSAYKRTSAGYVAYLQEEAMSILMKRLSLTEMEKLCIPTRLLPSVTDKLGALIIQVFSVLPFDSSPFCSYRYSHI